VFCSIGAEWELVIGENFVRYGFGFWKWRQWQKKIVGYGREAGTEICARVDGSLMSLSPAGLPPRRRSAFCGTGAKESQITEVRVPGSF